VWAETPYSKQTGGSRGKDLQKKLPRWNVSRLSREGGNCSEGGGIWKDNPIVPLKSPGRQYQAVLRGDLLEGKRTRSGEQRGAFRGGSGGEQEAEVEAARRRTDVRKI